MEKYSEKRPSPAPASNNKSKEDEEAAARLKRKLDLEQEAFNELMSYSVEQAYGIRPKE